MEEGLWIRIDGVDICLCMDGNKSRVMLHGEEVDFSRICIQIEYVDGSSTSLERIGDKQ